MVNWSLPLELKPDRLLVQTTSMGGYLSSVSLEWAAEHLLMAAQLPLFHGKIEPQTNNIRRDRDTIDLLQQRPLDWSRQWALVNYLLTNNHHKLPPLLVTIAPSGLDDPDSPIWDEEGRARHSGLNFSPIAPDTGWLEIAENKAIFVLDGQHRLLGIQGLITLLKTGQLVPYTKNKTVAGATLTLTSLTEKYHLDRDTLTNLVKERIGIELIPAILPGETRREGRRRIRSLFVHLNQTPVSLTKGQLVLLNENDGFAIIARQSALSHPLWREEPHREARVNWDGVNITAKSTALTTLQALAQMSQIYLSHLFPHWLTKNKGIIPQRPTEIELETGLKQFNQLWDYLTTLPSYQTLEKGETTVTLRRFSHEKDGGEGNLLFRPVGQIALVQAVGLLQFKKGLSLETIIDKLVLFDEEGGFKAIESPSSLWYGIIYDFNRDRIQVSGKDLASQLLVYIIAGTADKFELAALRTALIKARTVSTNKGINFTGKLVPPKEIDLPLPK